MKYRLVFLLIAVALLFNIVTVTATTNALEIEIFYDVITVNDEHFLEINFDFINNTSDIIANCIAVLYDGNKLVSFQKQDVTILSGQPGNATISVELSENKDSNYIKLLVWDSLSALIPINDIKKVADLDPYTREKFIVFNKDDNQEFNLFLSTSDSRNVSEKPHTIYYDTTKLEVIDLCSLTYSKEKTTGNIENTNITIEKFDPIKGVIGMKFDYNISSGLRIAGVNNIIRFKAIQPLINEQIKYIIE